MHNLKREQREAAGMLQDLQFWPKRKECKRWFLQHREWEAGGETRSLKTDKTRFSDRFLDLVNKTTEKQGDLRVLIRVAKAKP